MSSTVVPPVEKKKKRIVESDEDEDAPLQQKKTQKENGKPPTATVTVKAPATPIVKQDASTQQKMVFDIKPVVKLEAVPKNVVLCPKPAIKPVKADSDSDDDKPLSKKVVSHNSNKSNDRNPKIYDDDNDDNIPLSSKIQSKTPTVNGTVNIVKKESSNKNKDHKSKRKRRDDDDDDIHSNKRSKKSYHVKVSKDKGKDKGRDKGKNKETGNQKISSTTKKETKPEIATDKKPATSMRGKDAGLVENVRKIVEETVEYKWWLDVADDEDDDEDEEKDTTLKWTTLQHNGVIFPPPHAPHGVKLLYKGRPITLTPRQEEPATWFAAMLQTDYVKKPVFRQNFWNDWKKKLQKDGGEGATIKELDGCDFTAIFDLLQNQKEDRKKMTKEDKLRLKEANAEMNDRMGWAYVDDHKQKVANYKIEPPGLFRGRGEHPKQGCFKRRYLPEDVTINIGEKNSVPAPPNGGSWKGVVHKHDVTWLATWTDSIMSENKYVWLAANSAFKGYSDLMKFQKARKLKQYVDKIRQDYEKDMKSSDVETRQRATALYLIDKLALRAGNEKGEDEADTVGCCSLRYEHISFEAPEDDPNGNHQIVFDFLGKDSIRYYNKCSVSALALQNLKIFREDAIKRCHERKKSKSPEDDGDKDGEIFHKLSTTNLNKYLKSLMPGLTAKVFRTYNASITLDKELNNEDDFKKCKTVAEKVHLYNLANRNVAILCNHQRAPPKNFDEQMEKLKLKRGEIEELSKDAEKNIETLKSKGFVINKVKNSESGTMEKHKVELSGSQKEKKLEQLKEQIKKIKIRLSDFDVQNQMKSDLKTVALGTSKINYLDPRITVAWCIRHQVPITKIFTKTLIEKFPWSLWPSGTETEDDKDDALVSDGHWRF